MDNSKQYNYIALCAGYDGIGLGIKRTGIDIGFTIFVEIEAFAVWNLVKKIEAGLLGESVVWPDLKTFPYERFYGCFDILSAGFPCQPFSVAGSRKATEDPRHLFPYILKGINSARPAIVFLENVEGIMSAKTIAEADKRIHCHIERVCERLGKSFSERVRKRFTKEYGIPVLLHVLRELERIGYQATWGIFSASEIGAPHQRKRVFIMAYDNTERKSQSERMLRDIRERIINGSKKLADNRSCGCSNRISKAEAREQKSTAESRNCCKELANGNQQRLQRHIGKRKAGKEGQSFRHIAKCRYPSRLGQQQFEWEPPRTVGNSKHNGSSATTKQRSLNSTSDNTEEGKNKASESERTGQPRSSRNIQELGYSKNNNKCRTPEPTMYGDRTSKQIQREEAEEPERPDIMLSDSKSQRYGRGQDSNGNDSGRIQEQKTCEQSEFWRKTQGCDRDEQTGNTSIESTLGGNIDGIADWMDYAELCQSCDNRIDELRLLGNGVVPDTAARAFVTLLDQLIGDK